MITYENRIERIKIQNFKSLVDVEINFLQDLNLFLGANNSGKSNAFQALKLLSKYLQNDGFIEESELNQFKFDFQKPIVFFVDTFEINLSEKVSNIPAKILEFFSQIQIYESEPTLMKQKRELQNDSSLKENCENVACFIHYLMENDSENLQKIERELSKCLPESRFLRIKKEGNLIVLGLEDREKQTFFGSDLPSGFWYILANICIVHQPFPPKLILIENFDLGIHPRKIHDVLLCIDRLTDRTNTQIIASTHNFLAVNYFQTRSENVFVFDKDERETRILNVFFEIIRPENILSKSMGYDGIDYEKDDSLGVFWYTGFLNGVPYDND